MPRSLLKTFAPLLACALWLGPLPVQAAGFQVRVNAISADGQARAVDYAALTRASRPWSICVSLPHLKDAMFLAFNYGMVEQARQLGVRMQTLDAGGYTGLNNQIAQIESCVAGGAQAVAVSGTSIDGLNNLLTQLKRKGIPVVDIVNGVSSPDVGARVIFKAYDDGFNAGAYLARKFPAGSTPAKVAVLPGPAGARFVESMKTGFQQATQGSAVQVVEMKYGDLGKEIQARLVEDLLQTHPQLDYIVGSAVTVEAAVPILRARKLDRKVRLVSFYTTPGVFQHVKSRTVEASGLMPTVLAGRVALDTAVRLLENRLEHPSLEIMGSTYDTDSIGAVDVLSVLAPAGFKPLFTVAP